MFFSGEPGASVPGVRDKIAAAFGARVIDCGSMAEMTPFMNIAGTAESDGMLLWQDVVYTEVCDPATFRRVPFGARGTPVYTHLERTSQPMIRLVSGDLTQWEDGPAPCGRTYPRLPQGIFGRIDDMFTIRGENVYPSEVDAAVNALAGYGGEHRIVITRDGAMDELLIRLEAAPDVHAAGAAASRALGEAAAQKLLRMLGLRARVEVVAPGTFPRTDFKARRVIDDREVFRELNARLADAPVMARVATLDLVPGVLAGETRAIARLLTRAETGDDEGRPALEAIFRHAGRAHVVGITGVPGSGKSTLVAKLAAEIPAHRPPRRRRRDRSVVAVLRRRDSRRSHPDGRARRRPGRIHPQHGHARRARAGSRAARSTPSTSSTRRVTRSSSIETVGVGQDEVDVARAAHTTVVVSTPGLGDDIQAIKAGILEIADIHVVAKSDRPDADRTVTDLKAMLAMGPASRTQRRLAGAGAVDAARSPATASSRCAMRSTPTAPRSTRAEPWPRAARISTSAGSCWPATEILRDAFARERGGRVAELLAELDARTIGPRTAALRLLGNSEAEGQA